MQKTVKEKRLEWLEKNNFNENEETYIAIGNTYDFKDELKAAGFKFNAILLWHNKTEVEGYKTIKVSLSEVGEITAWGVGAFYANAQDVIRAKVNAATRASMPPSNSQWYGNIGDRAVITATLKRQSGFEGKYGYTYIYTFEDANENIFVWFTTKYLGLETGAEVELTGTIKEHKEYEEVKQTVLTRCKIKGD